MKATDRVRANIKRLNLSTEDAWTITDVIEDADKAAEVIKLVTSEEDFEWLVFGDGSKRRSNVSTSKKMLSLRTSLKTFINTEDNDTYMLFWTEMKDINDAYFIQFVLDLYEADENLMDKVNRIRREKKEAAIERGRLGAQKRAANKASQEG